MGDGYDRFDNEGGNGSSFVMGLLTGTVLGEGLGMLLWATLRAKGILP